MDKELQVALRYGIDCLMERSKKRPTQTFFYEGHVKEMTAYQAAVILTEFLSKEIKSKEGEQG